MIKSEIRKQIQKLEKRLDVLRERYDQTDANHPHKQIDVMLEISKVTRDIAKFKMLLLEMEK